MRREARWGLKLTIAAGLAVALGAAVLGTSASQSAAPPVQDVLRSREALLGPLDSAQRARLQQRARAWDALPLQQRVERRARYAAWRAMPPSERAQLRALAAEVAGFEPARTQALRSQFEALDEIEQRAWRLGPYLGGAYQSLQPLLAYAPRDQRDALLLMLRTMASDEHEDLAVLVQRTAPQDRQALREELLGLSPRQRAGWLKRRLSR